MPREFKVLIAGGGMAGLILGQLLELAGIEYMIFEKAPRPTTLGSAMGFGPNIMPLFEQLGMLEDIAKISKLVDHTLVLDEDLNVVADIDGKAMRKKLGYGHYIFSRPDMFQLLLSRVPAHKVFFSKKILTVEEEIDKVTLKFSDNSQISGDICVGADGGYSAVRQSLYRSLKARGILPRKDMEDLTFGFYNLLGTTNPMDPAKYPALAAPDCKIELMQRTTTKHALHTFTVPGNRFCWNVTNHVQTDEGANCTVFRNSEWGNETAQSMCNEVRDFKAPFGGTMADYIDATPKEAISIVMLEEKLFKTWYGSRTVLVGDACHKMLPSAGQGAINAIQDAVVLANNLYDLPDRPTLKNISFCFNLYRSERYPMAKMAFQLSQQQSKLISGQSLTDRMKRKMAFSYIPQFVQNKAMEKPNAYRPQVNFLPMVPDRGTYKVLQRRLSKRYQEEMGVSKAV
ncbi:hypothetical protein DFQ27_005820 [Actinomortierella ambigua]|uniref:FAD-binding domain-containing protein n=1 Tax=Actinomortierella ambigua TaxID=1343610 RepID=A0A9P6QIA1_9FUNG|nr:hypothetical protein DFQ26_001043 [Actinomortierella ambigua]KAG0268740.1 hypothetical protein DFQ27_005820 [Actinomortierella ambigua]